jgi:hypothetical protein
LWMHATSVASKEMPKWFMRLVPDVPLGAQMWVNTAGRSARQPQFSWVTTLALLFKSPSPLESEAPW